jgi:hypothetical protein
MFNGLFEQYVYSTANTDLKTEYSVAEEAGYRYTGAIGTASITFFNFNFWNRQITTIVGLARLNETINAGSQTTNGIDVEWGGKPWHHISPYVSGEYLHSIVNNDLPVGTDTGAASYLPTKGKTTIRSPEFQGALGLSYDDGNFFGNFNVKAVSSQYSTFMDDEKIPGYTTLNLGVGARLPSIGLRARPELKLNLSNLTNATYLGTVARPTTNAQSAVARNGDTVSGSAPGYYLDGGFAAMVTATQAF